MASRARMFLGLGLGLVLGLLWFRMLLGLGLGDRLRGDAGQYVQIALRFASLSDALTFVGDRSVGFPFVLYVLKQVYMAFSSNPPPKA